MKKILKLLLISLAILTISCSSSSDVINTTTDNQKQLDKTYEEPVTKSQTEAPKAKSTETSKPKSDEAPKAKTDPAPKADADAKTKADADAKTKADANAKAKADADAKAKQTLELDLTKAKKSQAEAKAKAEDAKAKADAASTLEQSNQDESNDKSNQDNLMNEISLIIKQAAMAGTLQEIDPVKLCSKMPENTQFKCEQEVTMDIQNEMSKNSSTSQSNKNKRQESDLNSKDPCASVPKEAKAECEKGIADARKNQAASKAKAEAEAKAEADKWVKSFDPNNIPKIAKYNFMNLDKFSRMSKLRSAVGHNYSYKTEEDDPTRQNCKSMKHYFIPVGAPISNEAVSTTPHTFKWMTLKFYSPVNGVINHVEYTENQYGTEANFGIQATDEDAKGYYFDYYHIALDPNLKVGSTVTEGQQLGTLGDENAYGEMAVSARESKTKIHLISFLEVVTDEIFNLYKSRGVDSPSDVIITREERDANPLPCDNSEAGWFIGSSKSDKPNISFQKWVYESEDNWFSFK